MTPHGFQLHDYQYRLHMCMKTPAPSHTCLSAHYNRTVVYYHPRLSFAVSWRCMTRCSQRNAMKRNAMQCHARGHTHISSLNRHTFIQLINRISTDIDILREQLIRHLIFLQNVVISARARERGAEEEAKHPASSGGKSQPASPPAQKKSKDRNLCKGDKAR